MFGSGLILVLLSLLIRLYVVQLNSFELFQTAFENRACGAPYVCFHVGCLFTNCSPTSEVCRSIRINLLIGIILDN